MKRLNFTILILIIILFAISNINAATYIVLNTNNDGAGSLRQAIAQANFTQEEDVIVFDEEVFSTPKTITLTSGQLFPTYSVVIDGPGASLLTISGNNQSRIFFNNYSNTKLTIKDVTLTQGTASNGGAILASNELTLSNVVISENKAAGAEVSPAGFSAGLGGGIYSTGTLILTDSLISNNLASGVIVRSTNPSFGDYGTAGGGGGIFSNGFSTTVVNCTFVNNMAKGISTPDVGDGKTVGQGGSAFGGAIYGISLKLINSNFINNSAVAGNGGSILTPEVIYTAGNGGKADGGAIYSSGAKILNSTFSSNSAIAGNGGASSTNAVFAGSGGNSRGGGIIDYDLKAANVTVVDNTVIAGSGRIGGTGAGGGIIGGSNQSSIINSTITGNKVSGGIGAESIGSSEGGGVLNGPNIGAVSSFRNNIVAENSATSGTDVFGTYINAANNLIGIGEGSTGITNGVNNNLVGTKNSPINPMLAPLTDNGGITKTRALLAGSPAVNAGSNSFAINPLTSQPLQFDQRGLLRIIPNGGIVDIGAFELGASSVSAPASPDLQNASDTGLSNTDNITNAIMPILDVLNVIPGAKVELLRDNVVVSNAHATLFSVSLIDSNPPLDDVVQYTVRQTIGGVTSDVTAPLKVTFDHTPPTVTVIQSKDQSNPATDLPIRFTVEFSEPVAGFDWQDISLVGSTADISGASKFVVTRDPSTFTVEIYGIRSPGQIIVSIPARAAYDFVTNPNSASTSTDNSVDFKPNIVEASISGRIIKQSGLLRSSSTVTFTDSFTNETWTERTNPFGYYNFTGLKIYQQIGRRFTIRLNNKTFVYNISQPVMIAGDKNNLNFIVP